MKTLKKILCAFLALVFCVSMANLTVFASGEDLRFTCDVEAHQHTDERGACYKDVMTDKLETEHDESDGHQHTQPDCYEQTCTTEVHTHVDECFETETTRGDLTCTKDHHTDECYETETTRGNLICTDEDEEHIHTDECYETKTVKNLTCTEDHHTNECYETVTTRGELICTTEVHTHTDECYELTCKTEVGEGAHKHDDGCYVTERKLDCEKQEHTHSAVCGKVLANSASELNNVLGSGYEVVLEKDFPVTSTINIDGSTTIDLNGHTISYTGTSGSVFYVTGSFTLKDTSGETKTITAKGVEYTVDKGTITGGKGTNGRWADHTVGGGVYVSEGATFTMYGGSIYNNNAGAGGGIYVDLNANLYVYGGDISNNHANASHATTALDAGGGGIWINGTAVINPTVEGGGNITILNNESKTTTDLGGGGIYVNNTGKLGLYDAIVTGNHANGLGGGLASCVHGKVSLINVYDNGAAIYGNTANGTAHDGATAGIGNKHWTSTLGNFVDGYSKWKNNTLFKQNATDIFCAGNADEGNSGTVVSSTRPVNVNAKWVGYVMNSSSATKFTPINPNAEYIYGGFLLGLRSESLTPPSFSKSVTISGNTSATHGGGIGCNGTLTMSFEETPGSNRTTADSFSGELSLNVQKTLAGATLAEEQFEFVLLDKTGKELDRAKNDADGTLTLSFADGLQAVDNSTYTFYVKEVNGGNPNISYDGNEYEVEVKVEKTGEETQDFPGVTLVITNYTATIVSVKGVFERKDVPAFDDDGNPAGTITVPTLSITNKWKTGGLKLDKTVVSATPLEEGEKFTFVITLKDETGSGIKFENAEDLGFKKNDDGTWTRNVVIGKDKLDENLSATFEIEDGIPAGLTYTVKETTTDTVYGKDYYTAEGDDATGKIPAENVAGVEITDTIIHGNISVTKLLNLDDKNVVNADFEKNGFTFAIYRGQLSGDITGMTTVQPDLTVKGYVADTETHADTGTWTNLRYGWYTIVETSADVENYHGWNVSYGEDVRPIESVTINGVKYTAIQVLVKDHGYTTELVATNYYVRDMGELTVSKAVSGNWVSYETEWHFVVTLKGPELDYVSLSDSYKIIAPADVEVPVLGEDGNNVVDADGNVVTTTERQMVESDLAFTYDEENGTFVSDPIALKADEEATISGIPVGTTYTVEEVEADEDFYRTSVTDGEGEITTTASEAAFINSRNTPTTFLTVNKVWVDDEETHGAVTIQLLRNGSADFTLAGGLSTVVTLSEGNGWTHTWQGLDGGYSWSAREVEVPEGYTASTAVNGTTVTITNTEIPEEPEPEEPNEPEEPENDIPDEDTPLADLPRRPEEEEDIDDPDVPLANVPQTGDHTNRFIVMAAVSGMCLLALLSGHKKDEEA